MIIWLASYPKSGNTFLRSLLASYLYSRDGEFDFQLLENIQQFPINDNFEKIGVDVKNKYLVAENYIRAQEEINKKKKLTLLKTHSSFCKMYNKFNFSNLKNSLGVIYIVRDPRNVLVSLMNHYSLNEKEALEFITEDRDIHQKDEDFSNYAYLSNWSKHYESWSNAKNFRRMLIKYEQLQNKKYETFRDLIVFVNTILNRTERVNKEKLIKAIETTEFNVLKKKEENEGFSESVKNKNGNTNIFFDKGFENKWENLISSTSINTIEDRFHKEMTKLGYIKKKK